MKYVLFVIASFCLSAPVWGQEPVKGVAMLPESRTLAVDAYNVFRTNKFLDFKDMDQLKKYIADTLYETTDLRKPYGGTDWEKVEQEDASAYEDKKNPNRQYTYLNGTLTESYSYDGTLVHGSVKTVYNPKGFLLLHEKKRVFTSGNRVEVTATINEFDARNRVTKIIYRVENNKDAAANKEEAIHVVYKENEVLITGPHGKIRCELVPAKVKGAFYSDLSARETASQFRYLFGNNMPLNARKYCTGKALEKLALIPGDRLVGTVKFVRGTGKLSAGSAMEITDTWQISYADGKEKVAEVNFVLIETEYGWRISDFTMP